MNAQFWLASMVSEPFDVGWEIILLQCEPNVVVFSMGKRFGTLTQFGKASLFNLIPVFFHDRIAHYGHCAHISNIGPLLEVHTIVTEDTQLTMCFIRLVHELVVGEAVPVLLVVINHIEECNLEVSFHDK